MKENILSRLLTECPFSEVFEDMETVEGCSFPVPRRKIGHIRADYDGWRWYNTVWPCHKALATPEVCTEIDRVYDALTALDALNQRFRQQQSAKMASYDQLTFQCSRYQIFFTAVSCPGDHFLKIPSHPGSRTFHFSCNL